MEKKKTAGISPEREKKEGTEKKKSRARIGRSALFSSGMGKMDFPPIVSQFSEEKNSSSPQSHSSLPPFSGANELPGRLLAWYDTHARVLPWRENTDPYRVWISEIMLQQTRVETVKPYFERFLKQFPDLASLASASEERLLKAWEGLGYYNRARNLQKTARLLLERHHGQFPDSAEELQALPGIGEYTAGAILSICFRHPVPAVDGNVLRVFARLTENRTASEHREKLREEAASFFMTVHSEERCGDFTQALMELGATICLPNGIPLCGKCPLQELCLARKHGTETEFPAKKIRKTRLKEEKTVLLLLCGNRTALRKRPGGEEDNGRNANKGLLAGLWEFPSFDGLISEEEEIASRLRLQGVEGLSFRKLPRAKHVFTHREWIMSGWLVICGNMAEPFHWATPEELHSDIALPSAFKAFRRFLP